MTETHAPKAEHPRREGLSHPGNGRTITGNAGGLRAVPATSTRKETAMYYQKACSFGALYKGLKKSCRNVRWKDSVTGYEANGLKNTLELSKALRSGKYHISKYQEFTVHEPKERRILASRLVDRQFQRSLCDNGLYQDIVEHLIRDNVACQTGRGVDDAMNRMKIHLQRHYRQYRADGWVLKCDIHHFFPETRHDVAKAAVMKYVSDPDAARAVCDIIDSFDGEKGIGLGSQISQLVELLVLNDLDHYIKERLRVRGYIRYMDDFILIHHDREYLKKCLDTIRDKLADMGFELNDKTQIFPLRQGVRFLQWKFVLTDTGKVLVLMDKKKISKQHRRIRKLWEREQAGTVAQGATLESVRAFLANAERGNTWHIQQNIKEYYKDVTGREFR